MVAACTLPGQGEVGDLSWAVYYDSWAHAGANKASAFVLGGGAFLESIGLPTTLARTLMAFSRGSPDRLGYRGAMLVAYDPLSAMRTFSMTVKTIEKSLPGDGA